MKAIYWNTKETERLDVIIDILSDMKPDLLFLSEIKSTFIQNNIDKIDQVGFEYFANPGCERVIILKNKKKSLELKFQANHYTAVRDIENDIYVVSVHLPSQMFQHFKALKNFIRRFRGTLDEEIGSSVEKKIMIIGDFNVNPHEEPMIDFDGFLAANSINSRTTITNLGESKATYYNPTWKLYSRSHFPGTKAFFRPSGSSYDIIEHHFLDQVVISQELRKNISEEIIQVIEKTNNFAFFDEEKNKIVIGDHLPLLYQFKIT